MHLHSASWRLVSTVSDPAFSDDFEIYSQVYSMLAVMTLNVGYFLSVLAGLFVGEIALGRYAQLDDGHH